MMSDCVKIVMFSKQLADSSNEKAALLKKNDDLISMISVNNIVRFGSNNQKGTKKKVLTRMGLW